MSLRSVALLATAGLLRGDRTRVLAALAGITVSIFVVVMHVAFLRGVMIKSTAFYDLFDFDAVVVSDRFQFFYAMPQLPQARLLQAASLGSVESVATVRVASSDWLNQETWRSSTLILFSFTGDPSFVRDDSLRAALAEVDRHGRVAADERSDAELGPPTGGRVVKINGRDATISASYKLGLRMYADGTAAVTDTDFGYYGGYARQFAGMGLVKLRPGVDIASAMVDFATLPRDVRVIPREQLRREERDFFVEVKPLGVLMRSGMWIGFVVGLVALYQALANHLESRTREFAVLRAMGHSGALVMAVGAGQLVLLTGAGLLLAAAALVPVLGWLERLTTFDVAYGWPLFGYSLLAAGALALGSGLLAMWRVQRMHPADLL